MGMRRPSPRLEERKERLLLDEDWPRKDMEVWIGSASIKTRGVRLVFGERRTILERTLSHSPFWHKQVG